MRFLTVLAFVLTISVGYGREATAEDWTVYNKVVVVTGAARGIGKGLAERFAQEGAKVVVIVDINKDQGERTTADLKKKYGQNRVFFIHADVTKDSVRAYKIIRDTWGPPQVLVNNAGIIDENQLDLTIATNLVAPMKWTFNVYQDTRKDKGGKGSTIINISDVYDSNLDAFLAIYRGAYTGNTDFSRALGHEYNFQKTGVAVIPVSLGFTKTQQTRQPMEIAERAELYHRYAASWEWQTVEQTVDAFMDLMKTAHSGESYAIEGGKHFESPKTKIYHSAEYIRQFE